MKRLLAWWKGLVALVAVVAFALALAWLLRAAGQGAPVGQPAGPANTPLAEKRVVPTTTLEPSPPPVIQPTLVPSPTAVLPTPTVPAEGPETPPVPGRAVTLFDGNAWLVELGRVPEAVTDVGDVAAIFGWNWDGTKLLVGRGRNVLGGDVGDTTELWVLDVASRQARQLTTSNLVKTASWSPVDDQFAYCEHGDVLTVATPDGQILHQLERALCDFTWSPDGSSIAVRPYMPDMIADDGLKYNVLAIWQLPDETLRLFSDAKDESHYWPVWSTDGLRILFQRDYYEPSKQDQSGWYIAEVDSGILRRVEGTPPYSAEEIRRSPQADQVAYRVGPDVYVMDFQGRIDFMNQGHSLVWAPDGRTLFYRDIDNNFQVVVIETAVTGRVVGGAWPSPGLYTRPEYFFAPGE